MKIHDARSRKKRSPVAKGMAALVALAAWAMMGDMVNAAEVTTETLLREMVDRDAVARAPSPYYVCKQASSWDRSQTEVSGKNWFANKDYDQYLRKETNKGRTEYVVMEDEGPGFDQPQRARHVVLPGASTPPAPTSGVPAV